GSSPPPFTSALRYVDRYDIVRLSGDFTPSSSGGPYKRGATRSSPGYLPSPATVDRLMLTSLGGWLDSQAHWDLPHKTGPFHNMPFTGVEALTLVTPDLKAPAKYTSSQATAELLFQPKNLDGSLYKFHFRGTDWAGDPIDLHTPVLWVDDTIAYADTASRQTT